MPNARVAELGRDLRTNSRKDMRSRRGVFALLLTASISMSVVALYQLGILKNLPDFTPPFNSSAVTGSAKGYKLLKTPDAVLALGSYSVTMLLAAAGSPDRAQHQPLLPLAMAAKTGLDAFVGFKYAASEWRDHRRLCSWCLVALLAVTAAALLSVPEACRAIGRSK